MRDNKTNAVASPFLASALLGSGAYGSRALDNMLDRNGIGKHLTLNPKAIKDLEAYAKARPSDVADPAKFIYRYSDLANKASKARLFNEDPRKAWEWFSNGRTLDSFANLSDNFSNRLDKIRSRQLRTMYNRLSGIIGKKLSEKTYDLLSNQILLPIQSAANDLSYFTRSVGSKVEGLKNKNNLSHIIGVASHEAALAQKRTDALLRLMSEGATGNGKYQYSAERVARDVSEALFNYKNIKGEKFNSASDYLKYMYEDLGMTRQEAENFLKFFKDIPEKNLKTKSQVLDEVRKILAPKTYGTGKSKYLPRRAWLGELSNLGSPQRWQYNEITGNLEKNMAKGTKLAPGIKTVKDMQRVIDNSPALTWLAASLSRGYTGAEFGRLTTSLKLLQKLRNRKLQLALGLGSAATAGLGLTNLGRNIFTKKTVNA